MSDYKKHKPNPSSEYKKQCWELAIGLQAVDNLPVPDELREYAKQHINGYLSLDEIKEKIYQSYLPGLPDSSRERESVLVSANIVEFLNDDIAFSFSPVTLKHIHKALFHDVYEHAGTYRTYNITKDEPILNNRSVTYADYRSIAELFVYDFEEEQKRNYANLSQEQIIKRVAKFTSDIWQTHAFCEGNTRTTAIFMVMYLRTLGFPVDNDMFQQHSKYFRNALVRANYADFSKGIYSDQSFLEKFYENLLFGAKNRLQNRDLYLPNLFPRSPEAAPLEQNSDEYADK